MEGRGHFGKLLAQFIIIFVRVFAYQNHICGDVFKRKIVYDAYNAFHGLQACIPVNAYDGDRYVARYAETPKRLYRKLGGCVNAFFRCTVYEKTCGK